MNDSQDQPASEHFLSTLDAAILLRRLMYLSKTTVDSSKIVFEGKTPYVWLLNARKHLRESVE